MNLITCMQTHSTWYNGTVGNGKPAGILWHDTGAGNPYIKRYVQPYETDPNYDEMIAILGKNERGNDWNHAERNAGLNAWIGKLADGSIATVKAGPWDYHPWGCGSGKKGSCNGYVKDAKGNSEYVKPMWLQFEICDDGYKDRAYFEQCYKEACEFTAYLCREFGIDPLGTTEFNGVTVPNITCHKESHALELGSNHGDVITWFSKYGKTMQDVRNDVASMLKPTEYTEIGSITCPHCQQTLKLYTKEDGAK